MDITTELAKFFADAWQCYTDNGEFETTIMETELVAEREVTEENIDTAPEGLDVGDTFYELSELGQQAWDIAMQDIKEHKEGE